MKKIRHTAAYIFAKERYLAAETIAALMACEKPVSVCGVAIPSDLNDLLFGDLMELQRANNNQLLVELVGKIILDTDLARLMQSPAEDVYGLILWVGREVARISELFASIKSAPTDEERRAGVESLNFGVFGIADWYARRMGMTDQDDALRVKWVRVYECMRMDNEMAAYERRLRDILSKK